MPVRRAHVGRQPPQALAQHPRRQVRLRMPRQDQEPRVVRHQMQPPRPLLRRPADPAVPRRQLVRPRAPAQQRHPSAVRTLRHVPQAVADHAAEAQVVVVPHQRVPARPLRLAAHRAHRHPPHATRPRRPRFRAFRHRRHDDNLGTRDAVCLAGLFLPPIQPVTSQQKLALGSDWPGA